MDLERFLQRAAMRCRALVRGSRLDAELDEELRFHLDHLIESNIARGLAPQAARREALAAIGGITGRKEECRDARGLRLVHDFVRDVRIAGRTLRRAPAFTGAAILTLALGIAAAAAMFAVVNGVLLRPLPFPEPERLFLVALLPRSFIMSSPGMADGTYLEFRERNRAFQHLAAFNSYKGNLIDGGDPIVIKVGSVTTEFFDALAVRAAVGRTFLPGDGREGSERIVVLGEHLWRTRFGSNPGMVGSAITLNGQRHTVVGVMPAGFEFPRDIDAWTPLVIKLTPGNSLLVGVLGRLKPGLTFDQAHAEFTAAVASLPEPPPANADWQVGLLPLKELLVGDIRRPLQLFSAAVLLVLAIACANVANLLLARASGRDREIAVRAALGAGRGRLTRQLLAESVLLSSIGAALGLVLAWWIVPVLLALAPAGRIPRTEMIRIDAATIAFAAGLAALTGLLFGLVPVRRLTDMPVGATLVPGARSTPAGHERFRAALVVAEIALALVLLTGAGLLARSFLKLRSVDPGFSTDNVGRLSVELPESTYPAAAQLHAFHQQMLARLASLPGVAAAGVVNWLPLGDLYLRGDFQIDGRATAPEFSVDKTAVSPGYFRAMGIRLLRGRDFDDGDNAGGAGVAIVSRSVARAIDAPEDVIGRRISIWGKEGARQWLTIVGVVEDVRQLGPAQEAHATVYQPYLQVGQPFFLREASYVVRTSTDPLAIVPAMRSVLRSVDRNQPAASIGLMADVLDAATAEPAFYARLLTIFALLAVLLALVGTYGVIAYSVAQRSREIGVRVALGADGSRVFWMVLRRTAALAAAGVVIGTGAAWGLTRFLATLLFEITPTDPGTFIVVAATIFATALLAGALPARRATRVDPLIALRHE